MTLKIIPRKDLASAYKIHREYVDKKPFSYFKKHYSKRPELFVGFYESKNLIAICWGSARRDVIILNSIAVNYDYWRKGVGGKLLEFFHRQAKQSGFKKVSVGSAGNTEKFYLKNGYKPVQFLVRIKNKKPLYLPVSEYSPKEKPESKTVTKRTKLSTYSRKI